MKTCNELVLVPLVRGGIRLVLQLLEDLQDQLAPSMTLETSRLTSSSRGDAIEGGGVFKVKALGSRESLETDVPRTARATTCHVLGGDRCIHGFIDAACERQHVEYLRRLNTISGFPCLN